MPESPRPQIVVYASADACAALEAAADCGIAVTLVSPAGAAATGGPAWFRDVMVQARTAVPQAKFDGVLDCADNAGHALAAIRTGVAAICFDGPEEVAVKIADIAAQAGCSLVAIDYQRALDLDHCADAAAACRHWLAQKTAESDG